MDKDIIKMQREALETLKYIAKILPEKHIQYALAEGRVALEKQIQKQIYVCNYGKAHCPVCNTDIHGVGKINFCFSCGQKLDWYRI